MPLPFPTSNVVSLLAEIISLVSYDLLLRAVKLSHDVLNAVSDNISAEIFKAEVNSCRPTSFFT